MRSCSRVIRANHVVIFTKAKLKVAMNKNAAETEEQGPQPLGAQFADVRLEPHRRQRHRQQKGRQHHNVGLERRGHGR